MKKFYFFSSCFFCFLATGYATGSVNKACLDKEKALASLETAEILLSKAEASFPSCKEDGNSTDESECGSKKPLAYIEISKNLISNVRRNFPSCSKPIGKDDKIVDEKIVKEDKPRDCSEILKSGRNESGVYTIWIGEPLATLNPLQVYCDMETDNVGWTVIQRRGKYQVQQDFFLDWESYKNGFGNITQEFWLGNENIRILCLKGCEIRFDLQDEDGKKGFAFYESFELSGVNYTLYISGYTGNVGDSMVKHNNYDFSTKDKGNTGYAEQFRGGWWHGENGYYCNLNGFYQPGNANVETVGWYNWRKYKNLSRVEIKLRPK